MKDLAAFKKELTRVLKSQEDGPAVLLDTLRSRWDKVSFVENDPSDVARDILSVFVKVWA